MAAAANDNKDVSAEYCTPGVCWGYDHGWYWPCENKGVMCVGALGTASTGKASYSNYGAGVDIFAPGTVFTGPDPDRPGNIIQTKFGTSVAAPFAAGVAALVWAADPTLSVDQVESILLRTAHASSDPRVGKYVDAHAAAIDALGYQPVEQGIRPDRLSRRVDVPANQLLVETGIEVTAGSPLSITAEGSWSHVGWGPVGPAGFPGVRVAGTVCNADLGSLVAVIGTAAGLPYCLPVGTSYFGTSPVSGRLYLTMNDLPGSFGDNTGTLRATVGFAGTSYAEVVAPASAPWIDTRIVAPAGTPFFIRASGLWSNIGAPAFGGEGAGFRHPAAMVPDANVGALIAQSGGAWFSLGSNFEDDVFRSQQSLLLAINDVPGAYADNQGALTIQVGFGRIIR